MSPIHQERTNSRLRAVHAALLILSVLIPTSGSGQNFDYYWDGDGSVLGNRLDGSGLGGSGIWDYTADRWWDGIYATAPWPNLGTDSPAHAYFLGGPGNVTLGAAVITGGVTLDSRTGGGYILSGGTLSLDNDMGSVLFRKRGAGTDVVSSNLALFDNTVVSVEDGVLVFSGVISGTGVGIEKQGDGTLMLRGSNTYTGGTILGGGTTLVVPLANDGPSLGTIAGATTVNAGASLAFGPDAGGSGAIGGPAEPIAISGHGFRNSGALRGMMGANGSVVAGPVTMLAESRIRNDLAGTLTLNGAVNVSNTLHAGGIGFLSFGGAVSGSSDIHHFGLSGFRMTNTSAGQTYSGTIHSSLGEIRADTGSASAGLNPYAEIAALNLKDSWLRMNFGNAGGGAADVADSRFSTTAPIEMRAGQVYIDNASFSATSSVFFDYAVAQTLGAVTIAGGHNRIGFRSADAGSVTLTLTDLIRSGDGTTFELHVDNLVGAALGTAAKHRVLNTSLETAGANVPFVGGWAYSNAEFLKYNVTGLGGFGYTTLTASDHVIDTAQTGWTAADNVKLSGGGANLTADRTIQSLNIQNGTARTLSGDPGTILEIGSGGILTSGGAHTISVPFLTAGAAGNYHLYDIAWSSNIILSDITDNGANPVSFVKTGGGITSMRTGNSYTGTTYINEGVFRGVIGSLGTALGSGNLTFGGSPNGLAAYETDQDFLRPIGAGAGEVRFLGGGGVGGGSSGINAYGAPVRVDFGGAGATVNWGSANFDPGIFGLNVGGASTHAITVVNPFDLGGEQRYLRVDGGASGAERGAIVTMEGDLSNGGIVKRGGGLLVFESPKSYEGGTLVNQGTLWLRGNATAGANVIGNDIQIAPDAVLKIESPSNIGSRQMIILQNNDVNTPAVISFGTGYGTGSEIVFNSFTATGGDPATGPNHILIANNQAGQARRIAVTISGNHDFQNDVLGQIRAVAPNVEAWFGADTRNGTFTGATLSPSGGAIPGYRLGGHTNNGGVLTIANANVLTDDALGAPTPLIVGAPDQTDRNYTDGTIYIPEAQSFSGQVTIGQGGILWAGENGSLGTGSADILLRAGELRIDTTGGNFGGAVGTQYAARNLNIAGGTGTIRTSTLHGGGFNTSTINNLIFDANRALQVFSIGTNFTDLAVNDIVFANSANAIDLNVGVDNSFQAGAGGMTVNGTIANQPTGAQTLRKNNGGVLVLNGANSYDGGTIVTQGRLVLSHTGAAGTGTIQLNANGDRRGDLEYRIDGTGPFLFDNPVTTGGGNDNSTRVITVGPVGTGSENQTVLIPSLAIGHGGAYTVGGAGSSAVFLDGFNGYNIRIGAVTLNRDISLRTRGALTTITGVVSGAAGNDLEKNEPGTLWLEGDNTYQGSTTVSNGYLVLGHDNALGSASSDVVFRNNVFSQILAAGTRTIGRNFVNTATGGLQTLGGLDAGAKRFTGNVNLSSSGLALSAITGGDVTFSGVISGANGIDKQGNGTVILAPASGTGNTFTGTTTVTQGSLIGKAQATSGSPFGANTAFSMIDGILQLDGLAAPSGHSITASSGGLTFSGGARVVVNDAAADGFNTELGFGSLVRSGTGTITFVPQRGDLGGEERVTFTTAPSLVNSIIGPFAIRWQNGASNAADYVTMSGNDVVTATYGGTGDLDLASGATQVFNAGATGGTLTGDRSVFAFRTDANVALGGFTLNVGDVATPANGAGIILNTGADLVGTAGSRINVGQATLYLYVDDAAVSTLWVPVTNVRNNATNNLGAAWVKFGSGTLDIGVPQTIQGNIELNRGTFNLTAPNVFPLFGNLNSVTGGTMTISPGTSIVFNNHDQEFAGLASFNPSNAFQSSAGTVDLGTATLTVGRNNANTVYDGQITGGGGSVLLKVGTGRLTLTNINGDKPNTLGTLDIAQGVVETHIHDQSLATPVAVSPSLPSSTVVQLRGGEWEIRSIGDSTGNQQRIAIGNNVVSTGANGIIDVNRPSGGGANKLLTLGTLSLDRNQLLFTGGSNYIPRFDGTTTLTNHSRVQTDTPLVLAGAISDGGNGYTLNKVGGSDLSIGGDSSASWTGGMVVTGGTVLFATRGLDEIRSPGTTLVPLATSNAGSGDLIVNLGSAIRITSPSNILTGQGQEVRVYGSQRGSTTRIDLLTDAPLADYGLRSLTDGAIALGMSEGIWSTPLDMARLGNGSWGLSAISNTFYNSPTLGVGKGGIYSFGGSAGATLSFTRANVLTGDHSVELGKSPIFAGGTPAGAGAVIRLYDNQDYTGSTTIFRVADGGSIGAVLEITGDSSSSTFDVYGRLTLRGAGRLTDDSGAQVNALNLRPGGNLRLDYNMDVADSIFNARLRESNLGREIDENKLGDTTPLILDGAGINLINGGGRVNMETVGMITVKGGAGITLERNGTNGQMVLTAPGITRDGQSTLTIRENVNELGSNNLQSLKFILGTAPSLTNGMADPWMVNATRRTFLGYDANTGFVNAPFVTGTPAGGGGNAFLSGFTGTEIVQFSGGWGDTTLTGTKNVHALRVDEESSTNDMIFTGGQINIWSGGLILGSDDGNRVNFDTTAVYFGNGTMPVEGIVYAGHSGPNQRFGGVVTAANLTFDGPGGFHLTNTANAITGTIQLNGGRLYLDGNGTRGAANEIILHANHANNFNGNQIPDLRLRHDSATTTFTGLTVTVAENVGQAVIQTERFSGVATTTAVQFQNLNILGTTGPAGTLLRMNNSNSNTDVLGSTTIGGTSEVGMNVNANTWRLVGGITGAAPIVKTGDGVLRWDGDNSGFTGGFTLRRGEWRLTAGAAANFDVAGTGDVNLDFGTVRMAISGNSSVFTAPGQDLLVSGQVTMVTDRNGGAAGTRTIGVNNGGQVFATRNSPYLIFQAASFGDDIVLESRLVIEDSPVFRVDSTDLFLRDVVSGNGSFNKAGIWYLHFDNNAANTFSGGFNNYTGITVVRQVNATLGTGPVQVFAGSGLSVASTAQFGPTGLTKVYTSGAALPVIGTRTIANFDAIAAAVSAAVSGTGPGVLAIDNGQSLAVDPMMATRDGGVFSSWQIGSQEGNGNLTANSVSPWGEGGTEFLIGGGSNTLTLNPAAGADQFAGAGNRMILGVPHTVMGYGAGTFTPNGNNSYGGGTLVTRSRNLDGGYRGFVLSLQGGANGTGTTFRTPLGSGQVDVFGEVRIEGASGTAVTTGGLANANSWVFHPGSRIRFDNNTPFTGSGTTGNRATGTIGGGGRWADSVGITLNSAVLELFGDAGDHIANREIIGDLMVQGGSEVVIRRDTGDWVELSTGNLGRTGTGTLMIAGVVASTNTANMLGTVAGNVDSALFLAANGPSLMNNNMVVPWITSRYDNNFVKYDATLGFQAITQGTAPANYLTNAGGTLDGADLPLNDGTEILNLTTATGVLGANLDLYALRLDRDINNSADNTFNRIIIRSGGLMQAANAPTINADLFFGSSGLGDGEALVWASNNTLQINGRIFASDLVKSGTAFLNIRSDQPQFGGDWVINGGGLQFLTPGAPGAGEVVINGGHMNDRDNTIQVNELRYNFNSGSPDLFTWGGGKITVNGMGLIRSIATNDRLDQIPAIDLKSSGGGHEGIVFFQSDAARHTIRTGTVTLHDHYLISVDATSYGPGSSSGVQLGAGSGAGGLNNQGLYDVRVSGDGVLSLGDNSATFTGARLFRVGDGTVRVLHNGAFGANSVTAYLRSTAAMEIATSQFLPLANLVQEPGSIERWAVGDARGAGNHAFPAGVHWQVFTDVGGSRTIQLAGGSVMGYLPLDYDHVAVIQTIRSGVTLNLAADSYLGQIYPAGTSNGANHFMYDMGKLNTSTNLNPSDVGLRGSYLVIDGDITGAFGLTKVGQDVIKLAGNNTFLRLFIENGIIQIGRTNALLNTVEVDLRGNGASGILDLNGYDQEIGALSGPGGSVNNGAYTLNTLTVDQATDTIFGGVLEGSLNFAKEGFGTLELRGANDFVGSSTIRGGTLRLNRASGANTTLANRGGIVIEGGTVAIAADEQIADETPIVMTSGAFGFGTATGLVETVGSFTNSGGDFATGDNTVQGTGAPVVLGGGTTTVGDGGLLANNHFLVTGGVNTLAGGAVGGVMHVQGGGRGLEFGGVSSPTLVVNGDAATGGKLLLDGNLNVLPTLTSGTASIAAGPGANPGQVDLNGGIRTLTVSDGSDADDLHISAAISNGGIVKNGPGTLRLSAANSYQNPTTVLAGTLSIGAEANLGADPVAPNAAQLVLDGGILRTTADFAIDDVNRGITLGSNGGIVETTTGTHVRIDTVIAGDTGDLVKTGGGTLELTGANTYSSATNGPEVNHGTFVESGILLVNNATGSGTGDGDVIVAGGILSGHGAIGGNVRLAPNAGATITTSFDGVSDRSLAIGGDLDMKTGNTWLVDLVQNIDGASSRIDISGTLFMMAGTEISFNLTGSYTGNHVYTIASYGSLSGLFTHGGSLWADDTERIIGGNPYVINYNGAGNTITLTAVPEPGTWLVMTLVSAIWVFVRKRRRGIPVRPGGE